MGAYYSDNDPRKVEQEERERQAGGSFGDTLDRASNPAVEKVVQSAKKAGTKRVARPSN